jgi:hypothetical protein
MEAAASVEVHRTTLPVPAAPATVKTVVEAFEVVKAAVVNVYAAKISPAVVIPGKERLAEAQRAPAETAKADADAKPAAIPRHQSWRIP